jgi:hypothetical protein
LILINAILTKFWEKKKREKKKKKEARKKEAKQSNCKLSYIFSLPLYITLIPAVRERVYNDNFFFFLHVHTKEEEIRTSDLRFMSRGLQPIKLPVKGKYIIINDPSRT